MKKHGVCYAPHAVNNGLIFFVGSVELGRIDQASR